MEEGKLLIKKGLDYCKHVENYQSSKLLSPTILRNMAGIACECLLSGLSQLNNEEATHGNISSHLAVLQYIMPVPVKVAKASRYIEKTTSICGQGPTTNNIEMETLATHLTAIKLWVIEMHDDGEF